MSTFCRLYYRVPFSEIDSMNIVHHSNHARYLERGRIEFLRMVGLDYVGIMKRGMHYPLTELQLEFKKPLYFDDVLLIETSVSLLTRVRLNFAYKIYTVPELQLLTLAHEPFDGGKPSVLAETMHCCVNNEGRPLEAAPDIFAKLNTLLEAGK